MPDERQLRAAQIAGEIVVRLLPVLPMRIGVFGVSCGETFNCADKFSCSVKIDCPKDFNCNKYSSFYPEAIGGARL